MDASRARDYDSPASRDEKRDDADTGFSIRGAAKRKNSDDSRAPPPSRSRSPPRRYDRSYRDPDLPDHARGSRTYYPSRNDDRYNARYSSSSDHYQQEHPQPRHYYAQYQDQSEDFYDEPVLPPPSNGDNDISTDGKELPFLLIRGLKANTTEAVLSKGLEKLYLEEEDGQREPVSAAAAPTSLTPAAGSAAVTPLAVLMAAVPLKPVAKPGATPCSLKRVFVIRDRDTDRGSTFGFAEYHTVTDARAAYAKAQCLGDRCTISSKKIEVGYPHMGVFPVVIPGQPGVDTRYRFQLDSGSLHQYHDQRYYASILDVNPSPPRRAKSPTPSGGAKNAKKRVKESAGIDALDGSRTTKKAKLAETKGFGIVNVWQKKQAELRGEDVDTTDERPLSAGSDPNAAPEEPTQQSFVFHGEKDGKKRKVCLLCGTELPVNVTPERHIEGSQKHAANLKDEAKYQQGLENILKWGITAEQTVKLKVEVPEKPEYRDRAKERRIQEAKAGTTEKLKVSLKGAKKGGPVGKAELAKPVAPSYGKGMAMLQKAGWTEGQGLGSGGGIAAPIEQTAYNAGVGLGHEGSKKGDANEEAARMTKGGGGFLEKIKEVARERFERMQ